jgi:beta-fructofuranosidase
MPSDRHRPLYHFLPAANWMNDPNGLCQWGDTYHLFYQYNPDGAYHANMHWGHATSQDLVTWRHLPIALSPTPGGPDEGGCWSGCLVDDGGVPTIVYSGNDATGQHACIATSSDDLVTWHKDPANPVIAGPPPGLDVTAFRDHSAWREDGTWYQVMGAGIRDRGGAALLYRSTNLRDWEYLHPLYASPTHELFGLWTGAMWECPDFFAVSERYVLLASAWEAGYLKYVTAMTGDYADQRFTPHMVRKLDHGDFHFYAAQSMQDRTGRRIVIGWVQEGRSRDAQRESGWSGVMSLPREILPADDGWLRLRPVAEVDTLRERELRRGPLRVTASGKVELEDVRGDAFEIELTLESEFSGVFGLSLRHSPADQEETRLSYDAGRGLLTIDRSRSSLDADTRREPHQAPLNLSPGEPLRLRVFLDRSLIEVFANERVAITTRVYPTRDDSLGVSLFAENQAADLVEVAAWKMRSIW